MNGAIYLKLWTYIDVVMVHWRCLDVLGSTSQLIKESSSFDLKWIKLCSNGSTASTSWQVGKSIRLRLLIPPCAVKVHRMECSSNFSGKKTRLTIWKFFVILDGSVLSPFKRCVVRQMFKFRLALDLCVFLPPLKILQI